MQIQNSAKEKNTSFPPISCEILRHFFVSSIFLKTMKPNPLDFPEAIRKGKKVSYISGEKEKKKKKKKHLL